MKKKYFLLAICFGSLQAFAQPVFTYGDNVVDKQEFLRAYNKNKPSVDNREKSLREYLDLYANFKLKVKAAEGLRLDTLEQLQFDIKSFSSQVAEGYLADNKRMKAMLEEVFTRNKKDIHLLHFFAPFADNSTDAQKAQADKTMQQLAQALKTGTTDYAAITQNLADQTVSVEDMGFITALSLPYAIENLVYKTAPGKITTIYRTKKGLHIFKNLAERNSPGRWKIAQLLLSTPPNASPQEMEGIARKIDSIYQRLLGGADFATLAKQYSEDQLTAFNGGEITGFGTAKFDSVFENQVLALQKDGALTKPFQTAYGFHIVKRLQVEPMPADASDENWAAEFKQLIAKDARGIAAKADFVKELSAKTGFKRNTMVKEATLFACADSVVETRSTEGYSINDKTIFSFAKSTVKGDDWLNFIRDYKLNEDVYAGESNEALLDKFILTSIEDYFRKHLDEYSPDYKYQMQEFKEGSLLFEVMERNVWTKAAEDSVGLNKYFAAHKEKYQWAESADILLFNCTDSLGALQTAALVQTGANWKQLAEQSEGRMQSDSGRYELGQLSLPASASIAAGYVSPPMVNSTDGSATFIKVLKVYPANQPRSFSEAKGLVVSDYQTVLEAAWMAELKKRYPIKINEATLKGIVQAKP